MFNILTPPNVAYIGSKKKKEVHRPPIMSRVKAIGDDIWKNRVEKCNAELFALTYGSLVSQLCKDLNNDYTKVNDQLFKMGYNIGCRIIEDFLARTGFPRCSSFKETGDVVGKCAFKIFLNVSPHVMHVNETTFNLQFDENPLAEFVELPEEAKKLWYSNILCGVVKGALEMVQLETETAFVSDRLRGDATTEIRVKLLKVLKDEIPAGED